MLIRSQNKKELHNLDKIYMLEVIPQYGKNTNNYLVEINHTKSIGTYSTEEKAMKVLDMIERAYGNTTIFTDENENIQLVCEQVRFQMPQDSEVKNEQIK